MSGLLAFFSPGPIELVFILGLASVLVLTLGWVTQLVVLRARNSNLAPCPDCGKYISHQAPACPKCGRPLLPDQNA